MLTQDAAAARANSGGSNREMNAPSLHGEQRVDRGQRAAHDVVAAGATARTHGVRFSTRTRSLTSGYGPSGRLGRHPHHGRDGLAAPHDAAHEPARAVAQRSRSLRDAAQLEGHHPLAGEQLSEPRPARSSSSSTASSHGVCSGAVDLEGRPRARRRRRPSVDRSTWRSCTRRNRTLDVERASVPASRRHSVCIDQSSPPSVSANWPWRDHAELPAELVLPRRRPVGVQDVALVEHGVGDLAGPLEGRPAVGGARSAHSRSLAGLLEQRLEACSQVGSARVALNRSRSSRVSRGSRSQPLLGK